MSWALIYSRALAGMNAPLVEVEAHLANGLPAFNIVGLPDTEVKESRDRVRAAIVQSGFDFPAKKITVNLAPADLPKESGRFDLPIAMGILAASGQIATEQLKNYEFAGELGLSGKIRSIRGAIAMTWAAQKAQRAFFLPLANAHQATLLKEATVYGASSLAEIGAHFNQIEICSPLKNTKPFSDLAQNIEYPDLADVRGQQTARFALEIAASGGHSLLMSGPPGTGKSMLAQRLPSILPPLTHEELISVWSLQSLLPSERQQYTLQRPFRSPHHSASAVALVGGGADPRPGEISLAHNGVLFLDELPEFDRKALEILREPLENGEIHISRASRQVTYPAQFQLITAMNPCPCGYLGHAKKTCCCSSDAVARYRQKISGPLLDRIDLMVEVPSLLSEDLFSNHLSENSASVRERVAITRQRQYSRQGKVNALLSNKELDSLANINTDVKITLTQILEKLSLSARSFHRLLRVARTLADMAGDHNVEKKHILHAVNFRRAI